MREKLDKVAKSPRLSFVKYWALKIKAKHSVERVGYLICRNFFKEIDI